MGASLGDLIIRVGAEVDQFQSAMRGINDELKGLESGVEKTGGSIQATFNEAMQGIADRSSEVKAQFEGIEAGSMSLLIAGAELYEAFTEPLKRIAEGAVEAAAETEKLQIVMSTLLGSSNLAGAFVESLHQFAAGSPLSLPSIEQGAQRLLAFQFAGKDVIPILKTLGDVSAAFGQGDEGVGTLVGILGKIEETGSVSGRLVNSLKQFGGISALSLGLGKSQEETMSLVKKPGGIEATEGINALLKGWNEMFGGTAQSEMAGFAGMMANLKNQVTLTLDAIGQQLLPVGRLLVDWARSGQESIRGLVGWFAQLPGPIQAAAASIPLLVASIGPLLLSLAAFGFFVPNIVRAVTLIGESVGLLRIAWAAVTATIAEEGLGAALIGAISAPAIAIPLAIAAIVAALAALATWVFTHWAGVKAVLMEGWDGLKEFWQGTLGAAINWVITAFELMGQSLGIVWGGIEESQKSVFARMLDGAKSFWEKTKSDVIDPMMTSFKILIASLPGGGKILGVGAAFEKGEADKKEQDELSAARKGLHMDDSEFGGLHDSFKEKHKAEVEQAAKDLGTIRKEYEAGKVSVEDLTKATQRFWDVYNQKAPIRGDLEGKTGKAGMDRSPIDALAAEHTHEEAEVGRRRSEIEHEFQMSKAEPSSIRADAKAGPYFTVLTPDEEKDFQAWVKANSIPFDPSATSDYDMRGYWKKNKGQLNDTEQMKDGLHFPDTFKTPFHETFSNESQYAIPDLAPHWEGLKLVSKDGKVLVDQSNLALSARGTADSNNGSSQIQAELQKNTALAAAETAAAQRRKTELDTLAEEELKSTNREIDAKLVAYEKLYAKQKDGSTKLKDEEVKLNGERMSAQDKYESEILKNKQTEATSEEQINKRLESEMKRTLEKRLADQKRAHDEEERMAKQHADAVSQIAEIMRKSSIQHEEALRTLQDENNQHQLDMGAITKNKYLDLKQQQYDEAYRIEKEFIAKERQLLAQEQADLLASESDPNKRQKITDDFGKRFGDLAGREQQEDDKHRLNTTSTANEKEQGLFNVTLKPFETSFASSITALIEGTKTFRQAWQSMVASMLNTWISSLAQQAAHWVAYKLFELVFHTAVNEGKVASDASAAAQSRAISTSTHLHEVLLHAKSAAAAAFNAVVGIPLIGPILAPIAAAGAYVAVAAFGSVSAERGAVLPNENTIAFLHPKEMVLPSHISEGLQSAISSGGMSGGDNYNFHGDVNYHAAHGERMTVDSFHGLFMQMLRIKNLRMA